MGCVVILQALWSGAHTLYKTGAKEMDISF